MAARLGGPMGDLLRSTARHAFVDGLHITLVVSAGLLLLGALAALRLPRAMDCPVKEADPALAEPAAGPALAQPAAEGAGAAPPGPRTPGPDRSVPRPKVPARREPAEATGSGRAAH